MEYLILTNNSSLEAKAHGLPVKQVSGGVEDMYDAVGEHLQNGYALVSSPLPANVPLIRSPVRSIILGKAARRYDARGLMTLENARDRTKVLGVIADERIAEIVAESFDLRPARIIKKLDLLRPIYRQTAAYGHFGRTDIDLPWERTDMAEALRERAGLR